MKEPVEDELETEHAQINGRRLDDPLFTEYYRSHSGEQFLDVIEGQYLAKLRLGEVTVDYLISAMEDYVGSSQSGSMGSDRRIEADHIVRHVLANRRYDLERGHP